MSKLFKIRIEISSKCNPQMTKKKKSGKIGGGRGGSGGNRGKKRKNYAK